MYKVFFSFYIRREPPNEKLNSKSFIIFKDFQPWGLWHGKTHWLLIGRQNELLCLHISYFILPENQHHSRAYLNISMFNSTT